MFRYRALLITLFALFSVPLRLEAQSDSKAEIPTIKLTLHPSAKPSPALQYRLLPELRDRQQGNAVLHYYRAFSPEWAGVYRRPEVNKLLQEWMEQEAERKQGLTPPVNLRFVLTEPSLVEIDRGARSTYCEWNMLQRLRQDGLSLILTDIQSLRVYSQLLSIRCRFQIADGKFGDAAHSLQSGLQLSRDICKGPTIIQTLIGASCANVHFGDLEQWIQQKDSPNLYWSLSNLPQPFIDMTMALEGERIMVDSIFPEIRAMINNKYAQPMSQREIDHVLDKVSEARYFLPADGNTAFWFDRLGLAVMAARSYKQAKEFLIEQGHSKDVVEGMPLMQAVLMYEVHKFDSYVDEAFKWQGLPYPIARAGIQKSFHQLFGVDHPPTLGKLLAGLTVASIDKTLSAARRIDRKIAALRCVEAIRLYAAKHNGALPGSLSDIKDVPIPNDPMTLQPFEYRREGHTARLTAGAPPGEESLFSVHGNTWSYELRISR